MVGAVQDMIGRRFGRYVVLASLGRRGGRNGHAYWLCRCDCGSEREVEQGNLRRGHSRSCGCITRRHGHSRQRAGHSPSPTYVSWESMVSRCTNPNATRYPTYGGRGITVCERWRLFENFLADMGERPPGTTLDRYPDGKGNYEPGNCRWATPKEQVRNAITARPVFFRGERIFAVDLARRFGVNAATLRRRLSCGWPMELVITSRNFKGHRVTALAAGGRT